MTPPATERQIVRFGLFEADLEQRILSKDGLRVKVQDQPFVILALLLTHPGEIVTRETIQQELWPGNTFVEFDDGLNTAIKKLRTALGDAADNPRFIETVPRRGYRFLAPVTYPVPPRAGGDESQLASQPADVLIAAREQSRVVIEKTSSKPAFLWISAGMLIALIAGIGGYFIRTERHSQSQPRATSPLATTIKPRLAIAVMGFRNLSRQADEAWVSVALSEMLNTELAAGGTLRMIPGEDIARAKLDFSLTDTEALAKDSLAHVKDSIGADYVLLGSYTTLGEKAKKRIRLDLRLQDTQAGETIAEQSVDGAENRLFDLVSDAGAKLRQSLRAQSLGADQEVQVRASLPSSVEAARLYSEGLAQLRIFEAQVARDLLEKAVAADPKFPMAHTALASAWSALGYESRARQESKLAFDLSAELSPQEKLVAEGRYREANREWARAIEVYRTLRQTFPDTLDYGLRLASVQSFSGAGKDALATLASLRQLPLGEGSDPRIDLEESKAAEMMGNFRESQQAAQWAVAKARTQGAHLIVAQGRSDEGWAEERLGEYDKASDAFKESRDLFSAAGDRRSTAVAINYQGDLLYDKGDNTAALKMLNESLSICRKNGFEKCAARSLNALGHIQNEQGQLTLAKKSYEEVLRINRETDVKPGIGAALSNIGNVAKDMGDLREARRKQEEALQVYTAINDKRGMGATLGNLGNILDDLGELGSAIQCYERAYQLDQETGYKRGFGFVLVGWGLVLLEQDHLVESGAKLDEALKNRKEIGNPELIADSLLALAKLNLTEGRYPEAEKAAHDAASQFAASKDSDDEAIAYSTLAQAFLAEQRLEEARSASDRARSLKTSALQSHFYSVLAMSAVEAATGTHGTDKELEALIVEAHQKNMPGYEFEARLQLAKRLLHSLQDASGRAQLSSLQLDAKAKGYFLIARNAALASDARRASH